jgi:hypothetical protein
MSGVTPEPSRVRKTATNLGYGVAILMAIIVLAAILTGNTTPFGIPSLEDFGPFIPPAAGLAGYLISHRLLTITFDANK